MIFGIHIAEMAFIAFAGVTLGAGFLLAMTKNVVYAAFLLFVVLFGVAALYIFFGAEFLGLSQIILYVGGILVILIFGVMLTHKLRDLKPQTEIVNLLPGLLLATALFAAFYFMADAMNITELQAKLAKLPKATALQPETAAIVDTDIEQIGVATLTKFLLPFELISVLLLAALIGAAYLSRKSKNGKEAIS